MSTHPIETEGFRPADRYDGAPAGNRQPISDTSSATRRTFTETKNGFKTTEFYVMLAFVAAVLIAAYATGEDGFSREDGWLFASLAVVGYIVSRGLAKLGTREPYEDRDR